MGRKAKDKWARRHAALLDRAWTPFDQCVIEREQYAGDAPDRLLRNNKYTVAVYYRVGVSADWPAMLHLSIKRNDREVIHDWRDLQRIKNEVVGPECEAVELYPAESRLVDAANQYHLYALTSPAHRFPFGFNERLVAGDVESQTMPGAKQRRFDTLPADALSGEELDQKFRDLQKRSPS